MQRILLSILAGLYPALFFTAHNWYLFTTRQVVFLVVIVTGVSAAALGVLWALLEAVRRLLGRTSGRPVSRMIDAALCLAAACISAFLLREAIAAFPFPPSWIWTLAAMLIVALTLGVAKHGLAHVNAILLLLTLMSGGQWAFNFSKMREVVQEDHWYSVERARHEAIELVDKPNVYLILSESYPSEEALREIFGIDNSELYTWLNRHGFETLPKAYSSYQSTLASMTATFAMAHHYYRITAGNLDSFNGRDIISAKAYNATVEVFRRNGYRIQYIHEIVYQIQKGTAVDFHWPSASTSEALGRYLGSWSAALLDQEDDGAESFEKILEKRLAKAFASDRPYFSYIYVQSPGHSSPKIPKMERSQALKKQARFRTHFGKRLEEANLRLRGLIGRIVTNDPAAMVILIGDHGAWGYRVATRSDGTAVPKATITLDRLGVLTSIRVPAGGRELPEIETLTGANLFRHVFAYLSGDGQIIENRVPDDGYINSNKKIFRGLEEGRLLTSPIETRRGKTTPLRRAVDRLGDAPIGRSKRE